MRHEKVTPTHYFPFKIFLFESRNIDRLISTHWHDSCELIYCIKGDLSARVSSETYQLQDNDILLINSNVPHSTWSPSENKVLIMQFPLSFIKKLTLGAYDQTTIFKINPSIKDENYILYENITEILFNISDAYNNKNEEQYWEIMSWTYKLFGIFVREFIVELSNKNQLSQTKHLKQFDQIATFIHEHYQEDLQLKDIASAFGFNSAYFSRFFKKHMGINYSNYIKSIRLEKGYYLLRDTDDSIIDIALQAGFNSSKTFTNAFKAQFGLPPGQYKKQRFS